MLEARRLQAGSTCPKINLRKIRNVMSLSLTILSTG
jgi:hypothetical protein